MLDAGSHRDRPVAGRVAALSRLYGDEIAHRVAVDDAPLGRRCGLQHDGAWPTPRGREGAGSPTGALVTV